MNELPGFMVEHLCVEFDNPSCRVFCMSCV